MGTLTAETENLGTLAGSAIVHKALLEVEHYGTIESIEDRFKCLDGATQLSGSLSEGFKLVRATALAMIEDVWEELPFAARKQYDFQFRLYAEKRCPDLTWTTIQNHVRAARTFVLRGVKPSAAVTIEGETFEFNPIETPISKLVLARSVAESGKIDANPRLWELIVDPKTDVADLRHELFSDRSKEVGIEPEFKFDISGPFLVVKYNGEEAIVGNFDWEAYYEGHGIVKPAIDHLLKLLGITLDDEIIYQTARKAFKGDL